MHRRSRSHINNLHPALFHLLYRCSPTSHLNSSPNLHHTLPLQHNPTTHLFLLSHRIHLLNRLVLLSRLPWRRLLSKRPHLRNRRLLHRRQPNHQHARPGRPHPAHQRHHHRRPGHQRRRLSPRLLRLQRLLPLGLLPRRPRLPDDRLLVRASYWHRCRYKWRYGCCADDRPEQLSQCVV